MPCGRTDQIEAFIKGEGETPVGAGVTSSGLPLFVFTNPETNSFTIALRRPDGITCLLIGGQGYTVIEPAPPKKPGKDS